MPIRMQPEHFEFPKRLDMPVLKDPPEGSDIRLTFGYKWVSSPVLGGRPFKVWFFCHHCQGWIEGEPHEHEVNDLDGRRLCGRRGTEFWCLRCAQQIGFSGMMS